MNDKELIPKVHNAMYQQIQKRGYATTVDTLMDIGILRKADYENWRNGKVPYLEKVCQINLKKLGFILRQMQSYGKKNGLKESWTFYKQWSRKGKSTVQLRFTKTGDENIERRYATHYIKPKEENHAEISS